MKKNIQVQQIDKKWSTSCGCGICLYSLASVSLIHAGTKLVSAAITFVILVCDSLYTLSFYSNFCDCECSEITFFL